MDCGGTSSSCSQRGLQLGQFDFHLNASSSLTSIDPRVLLKLRTRFLLTLHTRFLTVYATGLAGHLCPSRKNIPAVVSICTSSTCQGIRLSSSLVKSSALSSELVRVYRLDDEGSPSYSSVLVRVYWLDDEGAPLGCHRV